ncbi:MAG: hypothetical protein WC427_00540 [Candidatus Paceibacterota bacterium]|jgi:hypothetical protein
MAKKRKIKNIFSLLPILVIVSACFYVFQIAQSAQSEYLINEKEKEIALLKKETATLQLNISQSKNLVNFEDRITEKGYDKIEKIDYLIIPSNSVATK